MNQIETRCTISQIPSRGTIWPDLISSSSPTETSLMERSIAIPSGVSTQAFVGESLESVVIALLAFLVTASSMAPERANNTIARLPPSRFDQHGRKGSKGHQHIDIDIEVIKIVKGFDQCRDPCNKIDSDKECIREGNELWIKGEEKERARSRRQTMQLSTSD